MHSGVSNVSGAFVLFSDEFSNELHAAGIPSSLTSLVMELAAQNIDSVQVHWIEYYTQNLPSASDEV